jgi:hypothetical protein
MRPRIGIIGAGVMGTTHSKAIHFCLKSGLIDGDFVGVADEDEGRRTVAAQASRATLVTASADELIDSPEINTSSSSAPRRSTMSNWRRRCWRAARRSSARSRSRSMAATQAISARCGEGGCHAPGGAW